jgi:hypothetical protein
LTVAVSAAQSVGRVPTYTFTYSGFLNGDTDASTSSPAGSYAITSCTGLSALGTCTISYWLEAVNVM